ncbi:MAG: hypothetical protein H6739_01280 [Alphaproteobacteria bacterium]|nr:hypothetical protein [Alphaproteobacteria bacterium]
MGDRPPPPETWDDLVEGIEGALEELGVLQPETRSALADGVREALEEAFSQLGGKGAWESLPVEPPSVTVLEGGAERPGGGPAPDLRVADEIDEADPPRNRVRVVRVRPTTAPSPSVSASPDIDGIGAAGRIRLEPGRQEALQTLYRGEAVRAYRVGCEQGSMAVSVDGMRVEQLGSGQSIDVEARLIRVHADTRATGFYLRL